MTRISRKGRARLLPSHCRGLQCGSAGVSPSLFAALLLLFLCPTNSGAQTRDDPTITLAAVGDILLDRGVGEQIRQHGFDYPFAKAAPSLKKNDIVFGNLECPLSARGIKTLKRFSFKAPPERVSCLKQGGLTILSLANNHSMDCGRDGLVETMQALQASGLRWCGAGATREEAESPSIIERKGLRIAFVGFCQFLPEGSFVSDDCPTIAFATEENIKRAVAAARQQADIVVASFHWGVEYATRPREYQAHLAHVAVEAGADLVLGGHPHVWQRYEIVNGPRPGRRAFIIYSLGNFVFDPLSKQGPAAARTGILVCRLGRRGFLSMQVIPLQIEACRPRPATSNEAHFIRKYLAELGSSGG